MITVILAYVQANLFWYATATNWLIFGVYLIVIFSALGSKQEPSQVQTYVALTFFLFTMEVVGTGVGYFVELANRRDFLQQRLIDQQRIEAEALRAESERLLLNILPAPVAERLKRGEIVADLFEASTVMFADMVNFTPLSSHLPPEEIVALLNRAFSTFDQLAEKYGLEKIKTIGDAYMVVSGVPVPRPDHAEALADMALEMQTVMAQLRRDSMDNIRLRIGLNSGPVVAGVIGLKKFIYDLWGDTVNIANRMESHGVADRVQCTEATYELLKDRYDFEDRGVISVKGKGEMQVYILVGKKT
jgi:class 3 adenylate cyclase